jgi:hypothetical protein
MVAAFEVVCKATIGTIPCRHRRVFVDAHPSPKICAGAVAWSGGAIPGLVHEFRFGMQWIEKPFLKDRKSEKLRYLDQYQSDTIRSPHVMKGDSP